MESEIPDAGYISVVGEGTIFLTKTQGYIALREREVEIVAEELKAVAEQMRYRRRIQNEED